MPERKQYIGAKLVMAWPETKHGIQELKGWPIPKNEEDEPGYGIEYPDGYVSWSPKRQFDEAYRPTIGMTFGLAIVAMENGRKVARRGWNGKGMFLYIIPSDVSAAGDIVFHFGRYIAIKTAQDLVIPWTASQTDMLGDDWEIVD